MNEISSEMAKYLFHSDTEVYKLYPDGTESVVEEADEINTHEGIFGVEDEKD